ncbi:transmembrane protein 44 isoform X2 [Conger conger]|uniref:transmembrane protein 44 isoform X2 n=1 Tax=Conger conger TaxID=82655 RepID=UPI002A59C6C6|nr:transmembrane protein 44 isoform X2 [Conger conger]
MEENLKGIDGERNQEERSFFDSSWWNPEFVSSCSAKEKVCISIGLCSISALIWVIACLLLLCKRCRTKERNVGDTAASALYCFLGNLSGTLGAFLSNQLPIQVFMGVLLATLDVLRLIFIILPFSGKTERMIKILKKRRRQNIFALSLPLVLGAGIFACHGLYHRQGDSAPVRRRLLSLDLQDSSEILGYALGLLAFVIGWTSRFPSLTKAHQERMTSAVYVLFGTLCVLANGLYGSAILVYDARPQSALRALPWLLASLGCAAFDVVILGLCCFRKIQGQGTPQPCDPTDTQSLLGSSPLNPPSTKHPLRQISQKISSKKKSFLDSKNKSIQMLRLKGSPKKSGEIGHYLDINIHPVQPVPKVFLKQVKISREGLAGGLPQRRTGKEQEEQESSSDSSSASSSLNPDLEWDFEEANAHWNKVQKKLKKTEVFPLRDWKVHFGIKPSSQTKCDSVQRVGRVEKRSGVTAGDQQVNE